VFKKASKRLHKQLFLTNYPPDAVVMLWVDMRSAEERPDYIFLKALNQLNRRMAMNVLHLLTRIEGAAFDYFSVHLVNEPEDRGVGSINPMIINELQQLSNREECRLYAQEAFSSTKELYLRALSNGSARM